MVHVARRILGTTEDEQRLFPGQPQKGHDIAFFAQTASQNTQLGGIAFGSRVNTGDDGGLVFLFALGDQVDNLLLNDGILLLFDDAAALFDFFLELGDGIDNFGEAGGEHGR